MKQFIQHDISLESKAAKNIRAAFSLFEMAMKIKIHQLEQKFPNLDRFEILKMANQSIEKGVSRKIKS